MAIVLSVLTTTQKGLVAETAIVHECVKLGIGVARPLDAAPYDLILDLGPKLLRVQCKWAVRQGGVLVIRTGRCRRGREGNIIHRSYRPDEIDAIAAYCLDTGRCYLLPHELSVKRSLVQLRVAPTKNNQVEGIRWGAITISELH
jgi:PD-(D/E)XK endonuclease